MKRKEGIIKIIEVQIMGIIKFTENFYFVEVLKT